MSTRRKNTSSASKSSRVKSRKSVNERSEYNKSAITDRTSITKGGDGYTAEAKTAMKQFSYQVIQGGLHSLRLKYAELKAFVPADPSKTVFDANQNKCRYKDVPCWDKTRIVLTWPSGVPGDFVHANRVTHELLEGQRFICCQGPLDATVPDFWRCVWQEKVKQIIMLCRCEEMGKNKCAQYWPLELGGALSFHGLKIKCEKIDTSDRSFVHSKLLLTYENETRTLDHRQWTSWPDKSVPKTPMAPFRLLQYTRKYLQFPTVIHCSAGVGRTGTLVMIEIIYRSLLKGKIPDVAQLVKDTRSQRAQAVQTEDQYLYCHYAILQLLHIKKVVPSHFVKHFVREYENYLKLLNDVGGKNLPMQATSLPQPCAMCPKVAAHMNDAKQADSPPSDSKIDSKKEKNNGNNKNGSKREKENGGGGNKNGSKREKNGNKNGSNRENNGGNKTEHVHVDRKAHLLKQLKTQKEEKEKDKDKKVKVKASGEPLGVPSPPPAPTGIVAPPPTGTVPPPPTGIVTPPVGIVAPSSGMVAPAGMVAPPSGIAETKEQHLPPPVLDATNQSYDPNEDLKPVDASQNPHKTSKEKCNMNQQLQPQTPPHSDRQQKQQGQNQCQNQSPPGQCLPPLQQQQQVQQKSPPPLSSPQPQQQPQQPQTPAAVPVSETQAVVQPPTQLQPQQQVQQQSPQPKLSATPQPQTQEKSSIAPSKHQYKPALTYTVQQAGTEKAAIVYHRNANQPFIKTIASPAGIPQPICLVQQQSNNPQPQQQQQQQNPNQAVGFQQKL